MLSELYQRSGLWTELVREQRVLLALKPGDPISTRYRLAHALLEAGDWKQSRRELLRALEKAPTYSEGLDLLLQIRARGR